MSRFLYVVHVFNIQATGSTNRDCPCSLVIFILGPGLHVMVPVVCVRFRIFTVGLLVGKFTWGREWGWGWGWGG